MENTGLNISDPFSGCSGCYVIGNTYASFMNNFYTLHSFAADYAGVSNPSESNYEALTAGQYAQCPIDGSCDSGTANVQNIVDGLENSHLTWQAYAEGGSGGCSGSNIDTNHFPFLFYQDLVTIPARCANLFGTSSSADHEFLNALTSTGPNYVWRTPKFNNDCHNSPLSSGSTCDTWLNGIVTSILGSSMFASNRVALFITFDEGGLTSNQYNNLVYTVIAGSQAKTQVRSNIPYNHYSYLHTIED